MSGITYPVVTSDKVTGVGVTFPRVEGPPFAPGTGLDNYLIDDGNTDNYLIDDTNLDVLLLQDT